MRTLKVEEVYRAGYETFADVVARLPMFIEEVYSARLPNPRGIRSPIRPKGGLVRMSHCGPVRRVHSNFGRAESILAERRRVKQQTIKKHRLNHQRQVA